jgi:hypothetical protein
MNLAAAIDIVSKKADIGHEDADKVLRLVCNAYFLNVNSIPPYPAAGCLVSQESLDFWIKLWFLVGYAKGTGETSNVY